MSATPVLTPSHNNNKWKLAMDYTQHLPSVRILQLAFRFRDLKKVKAEIRRRKVFFAAAAYGLKQRIERALAEGQFVSEPDYLDCAGLNRTALHYAVQGGHIDVVVRLIRHRAEMYAADANGMTPFHYACQNSEQYVLDCKNKTLGNNWKATYRKAVASEASLETLMIFLRMNGAIDALKSASFHVKNGNINQFRSPVHWTNDAGQTGLHLAAMAGLDPITALLCENGADVNACDNMQRTALHLASWTDSVECVRVLLDYDCDLSLRNKVGRTALHVATVYGHTEVAMMLVQKGAPLNAVNNNMNTPLHLALLDAFEETAQYLIEVGAETHVPNKLGETPMSIAVATNPKLAKLMLDKRRKESNEQKLIGNEVSTTYFFDGIDRKSSAKFVKAPKNSAEDMFLISPKARNSSRNSVFPVPLIMETNHRLSVSSTIEEAFSSIRGLASPKGSRDAGKPQIECVKVDGLGIFHETSNDATAPNAIPWVQEGPASPRSYSSKGTVLPPLQLMIVNEDRNLISHPVIVKLLHYKWSAYAKKAFYLDIMTHFFLMVTWVVSSVGWGESVETSCEVYSIDLHHPYKRGSILHAAVLWAFLLIITWLLSVEFRRAVWRDIIKTKSMWLLFDLFLYLFCLMFVLPCHLVALLADLSYSSCTLSRGAFSWVSFMLWMRCIQFLGAQKYTGPFVKTMGKMGSDMSKFVVVYAVVVLAFAHAFYLLLCSATTDGSTIRNFSSLSEAIVQTFIMMAGSFSFSSFEGSTERPMAVFFYMGYTLFAPILMVNLLIAMFFETYDTVKEDSAKEWRLEWAKRIMIVSRKSKENLETPDKLTVLEVVQSDALSAQQLTMAKMNEIFACMLNVDQQLSKFSKETTIKFESLSDSTASLNRRIKSIESVMKRTMMKADTLSTKQGSLVAGYGPFDKKFLKQSSNDDILEGSERSGSRLSAIGLHTESSI